jgi:hypothetical protein
MWILLRLPLLRRHADDYDKSVLTLPSQSFKSTELMPSAMTTMPVTTTKADHSVRYSSAMAWIVAGGLSVGLWTVLGLTIWFVVRRI